MPNRPNVWRGVLRTEPARSDLINMRTLTHEWNNSPPTNQPATYQPTNLPTYQTNDLPTYRMEQSIPYPRMHVKSRRPPALVVLPSWRCLGARAPPIRAGAAAMALLLSCGRGDTALRHHLEGLGLHVRMAQPSHIRLSHEAASGTLLLVVAPSCEDALRSGGEGVPLPPLALPMLVLAGGAWRALRMASSVGTAVSAWVRLAPHHGLGADLGSSSAVETALARSRPCGHPSLQNPTRPLRATLWALEERSPRRVDAEDRRRRLRRSAACPGSPIPPPLTPRSGGPRGAVRGTGRDAARRSGGGRADRRACRPHAARPRPSRCGLHHRGAPLYYIVHSTQYTASTT